MWFVTDPPPPMLLLSGCGGGITFSPDVKKAGYVSFGNPAGTIPPVAIPRYTSGPARSSRKRDHDRTQIADGVFNLLGRARKREYHGVGQLFSVAQGLLKLG